MKRITEFVKLIKEEKSQLKIRRTPSKLNISIFDSITQVPAAEWSKIVPQSRGLMQHPYLTAIENSSKQKEQNRYVLIYKENIPVAAAIFNIVLFTGEDYRFDKEGNNRIVQLKNNLKDKAKLRVLVCGHTHISGDHGFIYFLLLLPAQRHFMPLLMLVIR